MDHSVAFYQPADTVILILTVFINSAMPKDH